MVAFGKKMRAILLMGALALVCALGACLSLVGGGAKFEASAATATNVVYHIHNVTQDKTVGVNEKNAPRTSGTIIYYDSLWGAKRTGTGTNRWGLELKAELQDGKYIITEMTTKNGEGTGNMTIPENGFVLSGNGVGATALEDFKVGDELQFQDEARFVAINQTKGVETVLNEKNADPANCANVWTSSYGTKVPGMPWRHRIICEKAEGENLYSVKFKAATGADALASELPLNGIVFDMHGDSDANTAHPYAGLVGGFYYEAEIGDIIYFEDKQAGPGVTPADITVASGSFTLEVDGINPTADQDFAGKSLIYTNAAPIYKTLVRSEETVAEYAVEKKGDGYEITEKTSAGGTVIPSYDGFVLSIPSSVTGYDSLSKGDKVTVTGTFEQKTVFAASVNSNKKVFIDGANKTRDENEIIIYDDVTYLADEQEGYDTPEVGYTGTNQWGVEIVVELKDGKYIVTDKTSSGRLGNSQIPASGFVLSGNGVGATLLEAAFAEDDEVIVYDKDLLTNTQLVSITVNGKEIDKYDPATREYEINVDKDDTTVPVVACVTQTRMGKTQSVDIEAINKPYGTVKITVTATDGTTQGVYTLKFDKERSTNTNLKSLTVDGVALNGFVATTMKYTVSVKKGSATPVIAATAEDENATVTVTQATSLSGNATILVEAEYEGYTKTYTISFVEVDTSLASITVGDNALEGFSAGTFTYTVDLAEGTTAAPTVSAQATDSKATVTITQADSANGKATVTVTLNGVTSTYEITFNAPSPAKSGCGSAIGTGIAAMTVVLFAAGVIVLKVAKRRNEN
ncbi:MAG: hypothetical protein K2N84_04755 [Clostridia bacterium]|nr:hypothetical protein [Clostridia bacterium]